MAFQIIRVLLDQPEILANKLSDISSISLNLCKGLTSVSMHSIQLEHIAKLDHSTIHIAFFQQTKRGLVVFFSSLRRSVACRKKAKRKCDYNDQRKSLDSHIDPLATYKNCPELKGSSFLVAAD